MAETYHLGRGRKAVNTLVKLGLVLGVGGKNMRLLTVKGRKTGKLHSTPVTLVVDGEKRWLVAPYGPRDWVKNLRATKFATLQHGKTVDTIEVRELSPSEAVPVMRAYVTKVKVTRKFWDVTPDSPDEAFLAEAPKHPVFLIKQKVEA